MAHHLGGAAVRGEDISDRRRGGPGPGPVVAGIGPELAGPGPSASRIEHRRGGLVGEQLAGGAQMHEQALVQWPEPPRRPSNPIAQGRAVELDALSGPDLCLAVERQVIGVLADHDLGD